MWGWRVLTPHPPRILRACSSSSAHSRADFDDEDLCARGSLCDFRFAMSRGIIESRLRLYGDYGFVAEHFSVVPQQVRGCEQSRFYNASSSFAGSAFDLALSTITVLVMRNTLNVGELCNNHNLASPIFKYNHFYLDPLSCV